MLHAKAQESSHYKVVKRLVDKFYQVQPRVY